MLCMLCLKNVDKLIYTFSEYGFRLNVCSIISKHFWLKPNRENRTIETVCHVCWKQLYSFHIFYERIRKVHDKLVDILSEKSGNETSSPVQHNGSLSPETIALIDEGEQPTTKVSEQQNKSNLNSEIDGLSDEQKLQTPAQNENGQFKWRTSLSDEEIKLDIESEILSAEVSKVSTQQTRTETGNIISESPVANRENRLDVNGLPNNLNKPQIRCREFDSIIQKNINLVCNICSKPLESFFILKEHYSSVHNEVGYAVCCKKNFYSRHTLVHHILVHQDPKFFKCDQCGKVLANKRSLKNHTKTHTLAIRNFKCKKCEHSFTRKEKLDSHMQRHMKPEKICEKCGKLTRTLKEHQLREHSKEPRQRVQCPVCNAKLADNSSLHTHLKYQHPKTETLQHVCKICGKISSSGYGLKRHIVYMHKCERRHKCTLCGKAFKAAQILRVSQVNK